MWCKRIRGAVILAQDDYKPGGPAPEGYLAWHEWAAVQHKAGLRQQKCVLCGLWCFPQELSEQLVRTKMKTRDGISVTAVAHVCRNCVTPNV